MEQQEEKIEIVVNTRKTKEIRFYVYADECTVDWGDGSSERYATPKPGIEDSDYWRTPKRPYCEHSYRGVNRVVTVTVSATRLSEFIIEHIPVTSVRIRDCVHLGHFFCIDCGLRQLYLGDSPRLYYLKCSCNNLRRLDLSGCPGLIGLECDCNYLTELNLSRCFKLHTLACRFNRLKKLRVAEGAEKIHTVKCCYNNLSAKELNRLFRDVACLVDFGCIDYGLNPGTREADRYWLDEHRWHITNCYMEKKMERILRDAGKCRKGN